MSNKFILYRGDTWSFAFDFPYNITGRQFSVSLKEDIEDSDTRFTLSKTVGDDVGDDPVNGKVIFNIPADTTTKLSTKSPHIIGFQMIETGTPNKVTTLLVHSVEVLPDVVRN